MHHRLFQPAISLSILLLLLAAACKKPVNPCIQSLQERDHGLEQRTDSLILHRSEMALVVYRATLEQLYAEENQLFIEVGKCDFGKDLQAYNYWHRGRLKFPGKIEQELRRLQRDSVGR